MEFPNSQIHLEDIASIEDIHFEPLEDNYRKVLLYFNILFFGLPILAALIMLGLVEDNFIFVLLAIIGGLLLLAIFTITLINKSFKMKGLAIRNRDIIYKSGLIFRKITTIPFNRVQHVEINQGPIEKRFDLSTLEVFTAGGVASDLKVPGLRYENAQRLRAFIIQKTLKDEEE
jgi:membrane protein YdbS with pleckstrin-like domain